MIGVQLVYHREAVVVFLHSGGVGVPRVAVEKVVAEFFASFEKFGEAGMVMLVSFNSEVEKLECAVDSFIGALLVALR